MISQLGLLFIHHRLLRVILLADLGSPFLSSSFGHLSLFQCCLQRDDFRLSVFHLFALKINLLLRRSGLLLQIRRPLLNWSQFFLLRFAVLHQSFSFQLRLALGLIQRGQFRLCRLGLPGQLINPACRLSLLLRIARLGLFKLGGQLLPALLNLGKFAFELRQFAVRRLQLRRRLLVACCSRLLQFSGQILLHLPQVSNFRLRARQAVLALLQFFQKLTAGRILTLRERFHISICLPKLLLQSLHLRLLLGRSGRGRFHLPLELTLLRFLLLQQRSSRFQFVTQPLLLVFGCHQLILYLAVFALFDCTMFFCSGGLMLLCSRTGILIFQMAVIPCQRYIGQNTGGKKQSSAL